MLIFIANNIYDIYCIYLLWTAHSQIRKRLWEVELSEERIADLDDWRQDDGQTKAADAAHKELLVAIDSVQSKIDGFTKADMERNWSAVERDLRTLQVLTTF